MKTIIRAFVLACIVCLLLCGCAQTEDHSHNCVTVTDSLEGRPVLVGNIPCAFPLATEPTTLNILACVYGSMDPEDIFVFQKYSEMTGVNVHWTTVRRDERAEAVATALMNKQNLDLILRCKLSATRLTQYGESGQILDLAKDDLLKNYAPNCWAYLTSHPETLASVTNPDGTIYALPQVNSGAELRVGIKMFVNRNWLDRVHMQLPTTTEELYTLLRAFKEQDANGNGDASDEIPLCSANWQSIQDALSGAFGLENRGMHNTDVDCDETTGKVRLIAASDSYRGFLSYVHTLYSEGLLDNYIFTMTDQQWANNAASDLIGVFASTNLAWLPADKADDWIAIGEAIEGPNGDKLWAPIRANFHSTGAAVIPATCKDPALALKWLDYFWTDEGTLFYHMGIEGETFVVKEDGSYDYSPALYEELNDSNKSFDDMVARYSPYPGGSNPTVEIAPYFMGGEMAAIPAQAARDIFAYGPKVYWPSFTFTDEENETLGTIQADIVKYSANMRVEFITGTRPLSDWNDYVAQLEQLKMADMLKIYQAAVDRYEAMSKTE